MLGKRKTQEDFNRYIAKKTGSHLRIVGSALPAEEDSAHFFKQTKSKCRKKQASNLVNLACFAGALYAVLTTDIGYIEQPRSHMASAASVITAQFTEQADWQRTERVYKSNAPEKGALFFLLFSIGMAASLYGRGLNKSLEEDRKDLRTMALMPQAK